MTVTSVLLTTLLGFFLFVLTTRIGMAIFFPLAALAKRIGPTPFVAFAIASLFLGFCFFVGSSFMKVYVH